MRACLIVHLLRYSVKIFPYFCCLDYSRFPFLFMNILFNLFIFYREVALRTADWSEQVIEQMDQALFNYHNKNKKGNHISLEKAAELQKVPYFHLLV